MQDNAKENFSINKRFFYVLDYYNITRYRFSKDTGISEAVLLNIYKGKNKISIDVLEILLNKYEAVNSNWLLTGKGEMLKEDKTISVVSKESKANCNINDSNLLLREKDARINELKELINVQREFIKELLRKNEDAQQDDDVECAGASGA